MFFTEKTYDPEQLCMQNMHIHTKFSGCAKPEMEVRAILEELDRLDIAVAALTDHVQEMEDAHIQNNASIRAIVNEVAPKCHVLVGGEYSVWGVGKYTLKDSDYQPEFRLYSQNHYHCRGWEHPQDQTPNGYKEHCKACLNRLFADKAADAIAHPLYGGYLRRVMRANPYYENMNEDITVFGAAWTDTELADLLLEGYRSECAWELNVNAVMSDPALYRRYFAVGKEAGVVFTLGTDAHTLANMDTRSFLPDLKRILTP